MTAMFVINFFRVVQQFRRFNSALERLQAMSDRELEDIGINRSDVIRSALELSEK
jgi:uncharacterized protein YjiS (DUF1127 family)